jgi:hypothetical protein
MWSICGVPLKIDTIKRVRVVHEPTTLVSDFGVERTRGLHEQQDLLQRWTARKDVLGASSDGKTM